MAGRGLAGAVEGQHVVAAFLARGGAVVVQLLAAAVKAVVQDHGGAGRGMEAGASGPVEVAVQDGVLVRDLDRLDRRAEHAGRGEETVPPATIGVVDAGIVLVAGQEKLGGPVVVGGPHEPVAGADLVA